MELVERLAPRPRHRRTWQRSRDAGRCLPDVLGRGTGLDMLAAMSMWHRSCSGTDRSPGSPS